MLPQSSNSATLGWSSRVEKNKGHYDFIDAFYLLPKLSKDRFRIFFIGPIDNNEFKKIKNRLKNLSFENYFKITGFIKYKSLNILINLDLLVSLTKSFEGFGLSIAEALMAKKPVLVTKVGAVTEFLNKHNSSLINANNKNEIKQSLEHFLKNKKEWDSKALEGHKHIMKNFTAEITAEKYFKHINSNIS